MSIRTIASLSVALAAASACASRPPRTGARPLVPREGPAGAISVVSTGGLLDRTLSARFHTDQDAYVMVAHMSGDGVIQVLFPENPASYGHVKANRLAYTDWFDGSYDALPAFYTFRYHGTRSQSARYASYDGLGNGFVFMISSRRPLQFRRMSDGFTWDEIQVDDYEQQLDPRVSIHDFAEEISGGAPYTLSFAHSYGTSAFTSLSDVRYDCALLTLTGLFDPLFGYSQWGYGNFGFPYSSSAAGCRDYDSAGRFAPRFASGGPAFPPPPDTTSERQRSGLDHPTWGHRRWAGDHTTDALDLFAGPDSSGNRRRGTNGHTFTTRGSKSVGVGRAIGSNGEDRGPPARNKRIARPRRTRHPAAAPASHATAAARSHASPTPRTSSPRAKPVHREKPLP